MSSYTEEAALDRNDGSDAWVSGLDCDSTDCRIASISSLVNSLVEAKRIISSTVVPLSIIIVSTLISLSLSTNCLLRKFINSECINTPS